jgi:hypothetical protein
MVVAVEKSISSPIGGGHGELHLAQTVTSGRLKGHQPFILMALRRGPQTQRGLRAKYERLLHYMGLPVTFASDDHGWTFHRELDDNLASLVKRGLVERTNESYRLTSEGVAAAAAAYERARKREGALVAFAYSPGTASNVSVAANALLALVKLLAGFAFMSAALLADGLDSLIDVLSSSIVLLGVRLGRELSSAAFMVALMGIVGGAVTFEGMSRLMRPEPVHAGPIAYAAAAATAVVSLLLSYYQRIVGRDGGSLALVSQSIDSRAHVLQSGFVVLALILAGQGIVQADAVVAVGIGLLILRAAVELALDVVRVERSRGAAQSKDDGYEPDFGRQRWNFFKMWTLFALRELHNRRDIILRYDDTFTPDELPYATHRSPAAGFDYRKNYAGIVEELFDEGLVTSTGDELFLSDLGRKRLRGGMRRRRFGFFV